MNDDGPIGIGAAHQDVPCAGNPNQPGAVMFDCTRTATYVVCGNMIVGEGLGVAIVGACSSHVLGVQEWMRERTQEAAVVTGHTYTQDDEPSVFGMERVDELNAHFGETAWIAKRTG